MRIRTSIWIEDEDGNLAYGLGRQRILSAIRGSGSIKAAAAELGMSYRGLWARLRHSERRLGFRLVESRPGRGKDAGTTLTAKASQLLDRYDIAMHTIFTASENAYVSQLQELFQGHAQD